MEADLTAPMSLLLARAAVRGYFDPLALLDREAASFNAELSFIAQRSTEQRVGERWSWTLTPDARRAGLRSLPVDPKDRIHFLSQNQPDADDTLGQMLHRALNPRLGLRVQAGLPSERTDPKVRTEHLVSLFQAIEIVMSADIALADKPYQEFAEALRRSIAASSRKDAMKTLLVDPFRGRSRERAFLTRFANQGLSAIRAEGKDGFESFERLPLSEAADTQIPAVALGGVGGSGKSTLLSNVRNSLEKNRNTTLIAFDFDQPALRSGDAGALSLDFSRQLGILAPDVDNGLSHSRRAFRHETGQADSAAGTFETTSSSQISMFSEWRTLLAGHNLLSTHLVFVMDTFEEVLVAGQARLRTVSDWLTSLRDIVGFTKIRVIVSGRAIEAILEGPPSEIAIGALIELGDLGMRAGRAKLEDLFRRLGVHSLPLIPKLVAVFGSNPLVLEILARYCIGKGPGDIEELIAQGERESATGLKGEIAQKFVYSRILERISEEVRPLAHPGLVLRHVTPQLIREVLAGPCGLGGSLTIEEADALFEKLSNQVWLVKRTGPHEIEHRRDVRRLMLPQILSRPETREVAHLASVWYAARAENSDDRLESLYYQALAGESLAVDDPETLRALSDYLRSDVDDVPLAIRARIKQSVGTRLSKQEIEALPEGQRKRVRSKQQRTLVSEGLESALLGGLDDDQWRALGGVLGQQAESEATPDNQPKTAEVVQAMFNRGAFRAVARELQSSLSALLEDGNLRTGEGEYVLDHPAYLAALCTVRDVTEPILSRLNFLGNYFADASQSERIRGAARDGIHSVLDGKGQLAPAILSIRCLGLDPAILLPPALARELPFVPPSPTIEAWRVEMALRHLRQGPSELRLSLMHIFDPKFIDRIKSKEMLSGSEPIRFEFATDPRPLIDALSDKSRQRVVHTLSDFNRIDDIARGLTVVVRHPWADGNERFIGRTPEFYGPIRTMLLQLEPEIIAEIVRTISKDLPFWPQELRPDAFLTSSILTRLVASLVDIVDRCGQFEQLLGLIDNKIASEISMLYSRFCLVWTSPPQLAFGSKSFTSQ